MIMEWVEQLLLQWLLPALLLLLSATLFLASFGISLGVRRLHVSNVDSKKRSDFFVGETSDESDIEDEVDCGYKSQPLLPLRKSLAINQLCGGDWCETEEAEESSEAISRQISSHTVISRRDQLILSPVQAHQEAAAMHVQTEAEHGPDAAAGGSATTTNAAAPADHSMAKEILGGRIISAATFQRDFTLSDVLEYVKSGVASIIEDEVTQRFESEELKSWNLLTRTNHKFRFINWKLTFFWGFGCFFRYAILLPGRIAIFVVGLLYMAIGATVIGPVREGPIKRWLHHQVTTACFQVLGGSISAVITYHNTENRPKGGICVANHTSPIDVLVLAADTAYALTGQKHGGFLGYLQAQLNGIWFERGESKDRALVIDRLKSHVQDPEKLPILIFPEGTCINNTSIMQFKKGSFEVGGAIYPVAIKYDPKFGEAFWNSSKYSMVSYIYMMMTSWAIVCDVWYLPPVYRKEGEDAIEFANRVKKEIALKGGLVDLVWDGNLKRQGVKSEWKAAQQEQFSRRLKVE